MAEEGRKLSLVSARTAFHTWRPTYGTALYMPPGSVALCQRFGAGIPGLPDGATFPVDPYKALARRNDIDAGRTMEEQVGR